VHGELILQEQVRCRHQTYPVNPDNTALHWRGAYLTESVHGVLTHVLRNVSVQSFGWHDTRNRANHCLALALGVAEHDGLASL
jgi:hypothetical protein